MIKYLIDSLWPFIPENQRHLIKIDSESVREFSIKKVELYGPIWIVATLIIEFVVLGHLQSSFTLQPNARYDAEYLLAKQANYSLSKLFTITFLMFLFFIVNPFVCYLLFKNRGAMEVTFTSLL